MSLAVFRKPTAAGDSTFAEVAWRIAPASLHYRQDADKNLTSFIQTEITLRDAAGNTIAHEQYELRTIPKPAGEAALERITEQHRYAVPATGVVHAEVKLREEKWPAGRAAYTDSISIEPCTGPCFSSLLLVDTSVAGTVATPFLRNGRQLLPRTVPFFAEGERHLEAYVELYHSNELPDSVFPLYRSMYISRKKEQSAVYGLQHLDTIRKGAALLSRWDTFGTATLPSGNYYLDVAVRNRKGAVIATQSTFFQTINKHPLEAPEPVADTGTKGNAHYLNLGKTFLAKYNMAQLRAILKMIYPIADPDEANAITGFLKQPDEMYTRYFIYNYFSKKNAAVPEDAWKSFAEKIKEINHQFNAAGTMGYETDRGNIYLRYGKPDEQIRAPNEVGALPYEIWIYNIVGHTKQVGIFLFYLPGRLGNDYRLLTSTVPGELHNTQWKSMLFTNGASTNGASRAEQYLDK